MHKIAISSTNILPRRGKTGFFISRVSTKMIPHPGHFLKHVKGQDIEYIELLRRSNMFVKNYRETHVRTRGAVCTW